MRFVEQIISVWGEKTNTLMNQNCTQDEKMKQLNGTFHIAKSQRHLTQFPAISRTLLCSITLLEHPQLWGAHCLPGLPFHLWKEELVRKILPTMNCLPLSSFYVQKFYPRKLHRIHLSPLKRDNVLKFMKTSQPSAYLQPLLLVIKQFFNRLLAIWFLFCWLECLAQLKQSALTPGKNADNCCPCCMFY